MLKQSNLELKNKIGGEREEESTKRKGRGRNYEERQMALLESSPTIGEMNNVFREAIQNLKLKQKDQDSKQSLELIQHKKILGVKKSHFTTRIDQMSKFEI